MSYGLEYLHTSSKYIVSVTPSSFNERAGKSPELLQVLSAFDEAIRNMEVKETAFCSQFGARNFEELMQKFRDALDENDARIMAGFNASALTGFDSNIFNSILGQDVKIKVNIENARDGLDLRKEFEQLGGENIEVVENTAVFDVAFSVGTLKEIINKTQKKRKFHTTEELLEEPTKALMNFLRGEESNIVIYPSGAAPKNEKGEFSFRASPFNYSKDELRSYTSQHLAQIITEVENYIFDKLQINQGTAALKRAAYGVWNSLLMPKVKKDIMVLSPQNLAEFFAGGGGVSPKSWLSNTKGALGEFQTAVFYQYLEIKLNKGGRRIAEIVGSDVNEANQLLHTDVKILDAFGIQVKNYGSDTITDYVTGTSRRNTITVRLHPSQIPTIASDQDLMGYIINAVFNKSANANINDTQWQHLFESIAPELLNLDYHPTGSVIIPDKITAYHISGHLVPGSYILKMARQNVISKAVQGESGNYSVKDTTISGPGYTDEQFLAETTKGPKFLEWWTGTPETGYTPTSKNGINFWDSKVSIRTAFEYSSLLTENFKIF